MTDTVVTRIRLPGEVHRRVKAEAAFHNINLDEALGLCVAFMCDLTKPLLWRTNLPQVESDVAMWLQQQISTP